MNRARWITSAAAFLTLWILGTTILAPSLTQTLEAAAREALARHSTLTPHLDGVVVTFEGQEARLSGRARTVQNRADAVAVIRDQVRVAALMGLGTSLNPVAGVRDELVVVPYPAGWLMLATTGPRARLLGRAASEFEARDLTRSLQETWSAQGGTIEGMPGIDSEHHDEATHVSATLRGAPPPQAEAMAHVARIGGPWLALVLDNSDSALREQAFGLGVTQAEWETRVLPALQEVRATHAHQRQAADELRRLSALPPGHIFLASRDSEVTLRGELATEPAKRALLDRALQIFSPSRVHDEVRVSSRRRPGGELPPITTALMPTNEKNGSGKVLFLGIDNEAWKPVDWQVAEDAQPWKSDLPTGLDATLLKDDSSAVINWLQGAAKPPHLLNTQPAFITLAMFDGKAVLSGQVAEESVRAQIIAAVRQTYAPRFVVMHDNLRLNGSCQPFRSILHTLKSLPPPPPPNTDGWLALAIPAESWLILPATRDLVEAGGIDRTGRLPKGLSAALVEDRSMESIEQLRSWLVLRGPQSKSEGAPRTSQPSPR